MMVSVVAGILIGVGQGLGRHPVRAVNPLGQVLKLAALAAERLPRRLRWLPPAEHAHTRNHGHILWY